VSDTRLLSHFIDLPSEGRIVSRFQLSEPRTFATSPGTPFNRIAYSAAHVVSDPWTKGTPAVDCSVDWDATIAYRRRLWSLGLGVAEAMDTAQRGMGMDWPTSFELIRRSILASREFPGALLACGAGTDHLVSNSVFSIDDVIEAYEQQIAPIEALGGRIILMASRALARFARSEDDYHHVYDAILRQVEHPVIIHWLGDMFDPSLAGYWGSGNLDVASEIFLQICNRHADKVDGVKVSLLDKTREIAMRRRLDPSIRMYTGDDFNYAELIAGDEEGYSDALLGIFDAIAPAASAALVALAGGDTATFHEILAPTVPLSRHIFSAPTQYYKTGVVFIAYLTGAQDHFTMVAGQESARSMLHLAEVFRLTDRAGLLPDPELALARMQNVLAVHGVG
jgi:hypothetical protein